MLGWPRAAWCRPPRRAPTARAYAGSWLREGFPRYGEKHARVRGGSAPVFTSASGRAEAPRRAAQGVQRGLGLTAGAGGAPPAPRRPPRTGGAAGRPRRRERGGAALRRARPARAGAEQAAGGCGGVEGPRGRPVAAQGGRRARAVQVPAGAAPGLPRPTPCPGPGAAAPLLAGAGSAYTRPGPGAAAAPLAGGQPRACVVCRRWLGGRPARCCCMRAGAQATRTAAARPPVLPGPRRRWRRAARAHAAAQASCMRTRRRRAQVRGGARSTGAIDLSRKQRPDTDATAARPPPAARARLPACRRGAPAARAGVRQGGAQRHGGHQGVPAARAQGLRRRGGHGQARAPASAPLRRLLRCAGPACAAGRHAASPFTGARPSRVTRCCALRPARSRRARGAARSRRRCRARAAAGSAAGMR